MRSSIHTSMFTTLLALSIIPGVDAFSMVDHTLFHSQPITALSTTTTTAIYSSESPSENGDDNNSNKTPLQIAEENQQQDVLEFFLPAVNYQDYIVSGTVGQGTFLCQREGGPRLEELSNEQMLKIVQLECTDLEVNTLVWKCLGYRLDTENAVWTDAEVFPNWKQNYPPPPPDFINMQRVYSKQVDEPCLRVNQALVRSIPLDLKQQLKPALKPLGWTGYTMVGLTPNKTRRAQCANWLLFYRDHLFGKTIDQLREERRVKQEAEAKAKEGREEEEEEFRPPVKEVF